MTDSDKLVKPKDDQTRRITDGKGRIIGLLLTVCGALVSALAIVVSSYARSEVSHVSKDTEANSAAVKQNSRDIAELKTIIEAQVKNINPQVNQVVQGLNAHLQDPTIHHAGMMRLGEKLDDIKDGVQEIKTNQRAMFLEQQQLKLNIEVLKKDKETNR